MQLVDGADLRAQCRHLSQHHHAFAALRRRVDAHQVVALAAQSLGGDAQPAQVQFLELLPHLLRWQAFALQALAFRASDHMIRNAKDGARRTKA